MKLQIEISPWVEQALARLAQDSGQDIATIAGQKLEEVLGLSLALSELPHRDTYQIWRQVGEHDFRPLPEA